MVGDGGVGKTSFYIAYTVNQFPEDYTPTVFDEYSANVMVDGKPVSMGLWDTAGQSDYDRLRPLSYPQTNVFIVAYSVASPTSFENVVAKWIPEITQHCPDTPFVLFATKTDLREDEQTINALAEKGQSCVTTEQGQELSRQIGAAAFFEVSAKAFRGLHEAMEYALRVGIGLIVSSDEPQKPPKPDPPAFANGPDICDDLELLVNEKLFHDVVFRVEDKEIYGHKFVLCTTCPLFEKLILEHQSVDGYFEAKSDNNVCVVSVSQVSHVELLEFVTFLYSGKPKQSPTNEFINLAKVCNIDYHSNRRVRMQKEIGANVKIMHDIEVVANDGKKFGAVKALLWCRSEYFNAAITDPTMKQISVDIPSHLLLRFLDYANEGILRNDIDEELITLASKWSSGLLRSIGYMLVESVINLKNVFEWTNITRTTFPEVHKYCIWLMQVNHSTIKDRKEFLALPDVYTVMANAWPGSLYENRYKRWKEAHGKKKGDRCLVQ
jgi:Ras-related C3 botulinum toxin substrate 1